MEEATFDIWSGTSQKTGQWLETVAGLANAQKQLREIAAEEPRRYFIFTAWHGYVLDESDTQEESLVALDR